MDSDTKDRLFLSFGTGLIAVLTLCIFALWFRYMSNALELGIAIAATLVTLCLSLAVTSTSGNPGYLKAGRIFLWLGMFGYIAVLALGILRVVGAI